MSQDLLSAEPKPSWWTRPGGGREVLTIAAPLVVSSLSWTVMTFVDRMLLNHWSGAAMSAAFVAGVVWWAIICLPLGLCGYAGTFVAQYHGSGQPKRIGPSVWQSVWVALAATPLMLAPIPLAWWGFAAAGHAPESVELQATYFSILCWGSPALLASTALSCFWSGRGQTVLVMIVDALFAGVNLLLDYWWIFGLELVIGGQSITLFPAGGIAGAAWATIVSMWLKAITYSALMLTRENREQYGAGDWRLERDLLSRLFRFGAPSGVQMVVDVLGFTVFITMIASLGAVENEASSMTFSVGHLGFMPIVGVGMAASILVGQYLGENRDQDAARATWTAMWISLGYMTVVSAAFVLTPQLFLGGFFAGEAIEGEPATRALVASTATVLLRFVAIYNFLDAILIVFVSALKGAGDTRFVLKASFVMAILLASVSWLAVKVLHAGLYGCWAVVSAWIACLGVIFLLRFLHGSWRSMRVIEPAPTEPATATAAA